MAEITKDLKYYLNNPDEMPTDPKLLETLANDQVRFILGENEKDLTVERFTGTTEPVNKDERTGASSDAEAKTVEEAKAKTEAENAAVAQKAKEEADAVAKAAADAEALKVAEAAKAATTTKPEGILAKDGKNVIPFAVLSNARERADAAERLAQERALEIERLTAAKAGGDTAQTEQATILSDEELAALAEDSPTLAKILRAQQEHIQNLNDTVNKLATHATQQIVEAETEAKSEVQTAIDSNPVLAAWQVDADQTRWDEAARLDKALRDSPLWKDKSFDERFAKVVELTKATFGDEAEVTDVKDVKVVEQPSSTAAEIKAAAEAKLAAKKTAMPVSLSSIPGGMPPAVDEKDRVEQMSSVELGNKFLGMSKEQMETYLATL